MTSTEVNELVNKAILRWAALQDIDLEAEELGWRDSETVKELNDSREWDPTGITTFMMLRGMAERDLKAAKFSAYQIIMEPDSIEEATRPMRELRDVLEDPRVTSVVRGFQEAMLGAAERYGVEGDRLEELKKLILDKYALAYVRRDALASINRLSAHQFTQGEAGEEPKVNQEIYEFWNINSLLLALREQSLSGVTLVLIRDPASAFRSYFAFAIRNGDTITVLTDRSPGAHPAYERMSRRPDRNFARRAAQHWFPYDLVREVEESKSEMDRLYEKQRDELVPINVKAVPIAKLADLHPEQFVWTALMLDLIRERFWKRNERLPELSYTGEMVRRPEALVGAEGALAKIHGYEFLELPTLKREDVTAESTADQWERAPTRFNAWMVERYGDKVPDEVLDVVGKRGLMSLPATVRDLVPIKKGRWPSERPIDPLEALNPVDFGTRETLEKDRMWAARVNQMKVIQALADEEYEKTKDKIKKWCQKRIEANDEFLLNAAAAGTLVLPSVQWSGAFGSGRLETASECLKQGVCKGKAGGFGCVRGYHRPYVKLANVGWDKSYHRYGGNVRRVRCYEDGDRPATIFTIIEPDCPAALAILFDVPVEKLPWPLKHWYRSAPYYGNSILGRLDPEDWVLNNPWMKREEASFVVGIAMSRTAANDRRKKMGLPKRDWDSLIKKDDYH